MASAVQASGQEAAMTAQLSSVTVKVVLIHSASYTYDAAHTVLSDVPSGARVATSGALTGKTFAGGVFDADDVTFVALSGASCEALFTYIDTGSSSTSKLLSYHDGLTISPSGSDVLLRWNAGGIYRL